MDNPDFSWNYAFDFTKDSIDNFPLCPTKELIFNKMHSEMVGPKDIWDEVDYVYDMDLLATSLAAQLLRYFFWKYTFY